MFPISNFVDIIKLCSEIEGKIGPIIFNTKVYDHLRGLYLPDNNKYGSLMSKGGPIITIGLEGIPVTIKDFYEALSILEIDPLVIESGRSYFLDGVYGDETEATYGIIWGS
eukprot:TRINITY_DN11129_c0_g1_i1.p1 TRINITY_DN11129_c0_g1~~TRINITY_DN11129_c0_g1_i1.p1  ORF type:complete len:111 (+),score=17.88 TRINITY_DN11129_c0_g1_i1:59-391(+)